MFILSKLLSAAIQPVSWIVFWWILALLLLHKRQKTSICMLWIGLIFMGLLGFQAIPDSLLRPLENKYPIPDTETVLNSSGFIVLGGAMEHSHNYTERSVVCTNEAAERLTTPLSWLKKEPKLQLVYSGGMGSLFNDGLPGTVMAKAFFTNQGIAPERMLFESTSRNTRENAENTAQLLGDRYNETWILVTSANHMPRSVAEFERAGIHMIPYPVDFRTSSHTPWRKYSFAESILTWQTALHEWIGLLVYRLTA